MSLAPFARFLALDPALVLENILTMDSLFIAIKRLPLLPMYQNQRQARHSATPLKPGNFMTNLQQNMPRMQLAIFQLIAHALKNVAYTQLLASHSPTITEKENGSWDKSLSVKMKDNTRQ
ncbi:short-chain alcohol dehydrogenase [Fusarium napiforme]|uniref:Short-chain alcohol dehydrogenase n=1 Tax=Fusarium napiforme TaxID=42672 RepID=A0A8H5N2U2_9HYPO|nr:short-chain alcohol dehydrogenase [Fusarium napiforme]